jgi:hypothetical protein
MSAAEIDAAMTHPCHVGTWSRYVAHGRRVLPVYGVLADELGHAASEVLAQGCDRPELRRKA